MWSVVFYTSPSGRQPVREFIVDNLDAMQRATQKPPLELVDELVEHSPEVRRAVRRERLRLELARSMKKAREKAGLTQEDVARALGVTQAWVSKLENSNHDHRLESVLSYFDVIGGDLSLKVKIGASSFQVWGGAPAAPSAEVAEGGGVGNSWHRRRQT